MIRFIAALTLIPSFLLGQTSAQQDIKNKSVFFEIAGSGGLGSVNYEKTFLKKNISEFTWRVGLTAVPIDNKKDIVISFPLMVNALIGKGSHKVEAGFGQGVTITTRKEVFAIAIAALGYRYQNPNKKWFYRITYTPLISYIVNFQIQQWGGISIGYTFNKNKT